MAAGALSTKLGELNARIGRIRTHAGAMQSSEDARELVAFNLMQALRIAAELSHLVINESGWRPGAQNPVQALARLREHGVISDATEAGLAPSIDLPDAVARAYSSLDPKRVHVAATTGLAALETFAREVANWSVERTATEDLG
jgi:uncharacterized protein YutE (UPF0331/DUF86 family)